MPWSYPRWQNICQGRKGRCSMWSRDSVASWTDVTVGRSLVFLLASVKKAPWNFLHLHVAHNCGMPSSDADANVARGRDIAYPNLGGDTCFQRLNQEIRLSDPKCGSHRTHKDTRCVLLLSCPKQWRPIRKLPHSTNGSRSLLSIGYCT